MCRPGAAQAGDDMYITLPGWVPFLNLDLRETTLRRLFQLAVIIALEAPISAIAGEPPFASDGLRMEEADGRTLVVLPFHADSPAVLESAVEGFATQSFEAASRRIHVVTLEGETFRASTPLDGSRSWIVFDPVWRTFASLLPSIRVELGNGVQMDAVAEELGATSFTIFDSLGFAIVDLPADLHPADAVVRVRELPGQPEAAVRLRGPRIEWR